MGRGLKGGIGKDVPGAKDQVLQTRKGQEFFYLWHPVVGPFSQPNSAHLRETSYRLGQACFDCLDPCDESCAHLSQPHQQYSQLSLRRRDLRALRYRHSFQLPPTIKRMIDKTDDDT